MEKIIKKKLYNLRSKLESVAGERLYADALRLEGAIFHLEMLYQDLKDAGYIGSTKFE